MIVILTEATDTKPSTLVGIFTNEPVAEKSISEYLELHPNTNFISFNDVQQNHVLLS